MGKKQIEEQNAKDTETVLANRDEQLDDIDNVFSKQVQANSIKLSKQFIYT